MAKVYKFDTGTVITLDCGVDVTTATALQILATKPTGQTVLWTGTLSGTTALSYTTLAADLDTSGFWYLQSVVTTTAGKWYGEAVKLEVSDYGK